MRGYNTREIKIARVQRQREREKERKREKEKERKRRREKERREERGRYAKCYSQLTHGRVQLKRFR